MFVTHCYNGKAVSITYSECMSNLWYPACNAHAPYCHLRPAHPTLFSTLSQKTAQFSEKQNLLDIKSVLIPSTSLSEIF